MQIINIKNETAITIDCCRYSKDMATLGMSQFLDNMNEIKSLNIQCISLRVL
jgi:hypothetical protein